ncbi:DNA polymerase IV [Novimethylophilus kurashikiensis]|uniref:DNA polymerase IV n=1 Tax=Novimethylophilus kurashikiensis TaxID=1825523 RepID=A0A2R5F5W9_9PROT|nr:DNA polymerase IV [Novimethylophilus kurashikiensis]GBG13535.1 DNA polymerase IV [Novimethylophilus kurashikiensis]
MEPLPANHSPRRIAHLDMDMFFAGVELLRYPELRGLPMVVGGRSIDAPRVLPDGTRSFAKLRNYVGRGVVTTSTYEARALGVFSAMGVMKAAKLALDAVLLPADFNAYRHYSLLFKQAVSIIAPEIEDRGIDEIYIDLTQHAEETHALAARIKQAVFEATGLRCSIAVAPNKLLAKIGSDLDKPDGLTILAPEDIPARIWPLKASKVNGIGPKAAQRLASLGIETIGQLAQADPKVLLEHFGRSYAEWLIDAANGRDNRPVVTRSEPKSVSRETTFERDLHVRQDRQLLTDALTRLCDRVADDLKRKGYEGKTIGIKLRFQDFSTVTRDITLPYVTQRPDDILQASRECLKRVRMVQRLRLLGIRVGGLAPFGVGLEQREAFQQAELPF